MQPHQVWDYWKDMEKGKGDRKEGAKNKKGLKGREIKPDSLYELYNEADLFKLICYFYHHNVLTFVCIFKIRLVCQPTKITASM